jgi:lysophospholipase L1-like esterase
VVASSKDGRGRARLAHLARLSAATLAVAAALLAAELGWRAWVWGPRALTPGGMNSIRPLGMSGLVQGAEAWELRYELVPNASTLFKLARFDTNEFGMRDDPCSLAKPEGLFRIAFVGDSFTMGSGVELRDVFHSRIERALDADRPGRRHECLNFGVGGYNLLSYEGVLREKVARFAPDLVVVCIVSNDLRRPPQSPDLGPYRARPTVHPFWASHLLAHLRGEPLWSDAEEQAQRPAETADEGRADGPELRPGQDEGSTPRSPLGRQLGRLQSLAAEADAQLAFVYLNLAQGRYFRETAPRLLEAEARALGVPFFDTTPLFEGLEPTSLWISKDDAHPNANANTLLARGIQRFLTRRGLLD